VTVASQLPSFLIDAQLPLVLVRPFLAFGCEATHLADLAGLRLSDPDVWALALRRGDVLVTKDADFAALALSRPTGPQILWIRSGNVGNFVLLSRVAEVMPQLLNWLREGNRLVEVR
jgi:predicted nuclease of predicted toxin-antitoxin system